MARQRILSPTREETEMEGQPTHPPEVVAAAMRQEMRDLAERDPETAAALSAAAAKDARENDPIDAVEQEIADEALAAGPTRAEALSQPRRVTSLPRPSPSRNRSQSPSQSQSRSRRPGPDQRPRPSSSPAGDSSEDDADPRTVRGELDRLAQAGQRGARKKGAATEDDWAQFMSILFGFASLLFIWWVTTGLRISADERRQLELSDEEADALSRPAARILSRSFINADYGKQIMGASDYIVMAVVLVSYAERVTPVVRQKIELSRPRRRPKEEQDRGTSARVVEEPTRPSQPQREWSGVYAASAT